MTIFGITIKKTLTVNSESLSMMLCEVWACAFKEIQTQSDDTACSDSLSICRLLINQVPAV